MRRNWRAAEFAEAWRRLLTGVGRKEDAALARQSLAIVQAEEGPNETCALQRHEGRRRFAADLLKLAEDVNASSAPVDRRAGKGADSAGSGDAVGDGSGSRTRRLGPSGEAGAA